MVLQHEEFALERFMDSTVYCVMFEVVEPSTIGNIGEVGRVYLSEEGYANFKANKAVRELRKGKVIKGTVIW